jgi:guanylate kinase
MSRAVVLYGPPACGKNTVTTELLKLDARYVAYQRLKVGAGRAHGYRVVTAEQFQAREDAADILYRNSRYGNVYGVDRSSLDKLIENGCIPILHLGQVVGLESVEAYGAAWTRVLLWCDRDTAARRSVERGDSDTGERLSAWDETERDLKAHGGIGFDLQVSTDRMTAADTARAIHGVVVNGSPGRVVADKHVVRSGRRHPTQRPP